MLPGFQPGSVYVIMMQLALPHLVELGKRHTCCPQVDVRACAQVKDKLVLLCTANLDQEARSKLHKTPQHSPRLIQLCMSTFNV